MCGVNLQDDTVRSAKARAFALFAEREFFMRSRGEVRFIRVSSRLQLIAAVAAAVVMIAWIATLAAVTVSQFASTQDLLASTTSRAEPRDRAYLQHLEARVADLGRRQDFIDKMLEAQGGELLADDDGTGSTGETGQSTGKIGAALPETDGLARIEARQLAFVARMTRLADARATRTTNAIRALGLDPKAMMAKLDDAGAQGGPLLRLGTSPDGSLDPRFRRLGLSLARMNLLERGLAGIPQVLPAAWDTVSSGFGYRADPFDGEGAFHAGLDFKGTYGAPIYAAAKGTVSFVGQRQGYGGCIEIDHGNGLMTRYAHMSGFRAQIGQAVTAGQQIGAIGSSGRSTGPHLHFEVRVDDRPVNPRPFLAAAGGAGR